MNVTTKRVIAALFLAVAASFAAVYHLELHAIAMSAYRRATSFAAANPYEKGRAAFNRNDYATALRLLRPLADQGDARAQVAIGALYAEGLGVPQDYAVAMSWFRKAADQNDAGAQFYLGIMYRDGQGVPQDYAAAMSWLRKAADQNDARAQSNLAYMYHQGLGVPQDYAAAMSWLRKAVDRGEAYAQFNLAMMYRDGEGVPQDYVAAHMWYNLAAAREYQDAAKNRDMVAAKMTPAQIAEAQKLASEWKPK
jgi:uncharacterized protein